MRLNVIAVPLAALFVASPVDATCVCVCVEGVPRTVCTSLEEAAAEPSLCRARPPDCPAVVPPTEVEHYEPPAGATDCRSARLFDPSTDAYSVTAKLCRPVAAAGADED